MKLTVKSPIKKNIKDKQMEKKILLKKWEIQ